MATNAARKESYNGSVGYDKPKTEARPRVIRVLNTDYSYLEPANDSKYTTTDQQTTAAYNKQGLQPQGIGTVNNRKEATNEPIYRDNRTEQNTRNQRRVLKQKLSLSNKKKAFATAKKLKAKVRVSFINATILSWSIPLWFTVQLPLALVSIGMLGAASIAESLISSVPFLGTAIRTINSAITAGGSLLGIDIDLAANATMALMALNMVVFAIGILSLAVMLFMYILNFMKPLSGQASGLKIGIFLLAIAGYLVPIANLIPWSVLFAAVVWKYPK